MGAKTQQSQSAKVGVDGQLADRALRALLKHHESSSEKESLLLGNDLDIQVQFTLARIPGNPSPKPIRVDIPNPLVKVTSTNDDGTDDENMDEDDDDSNLQEVEACLIVKEESKPWVQEMITRFPTQLGCIKKILGLQSLRTKHKSFTQRRQLLDRFDVFFADDRILPMLTKALGGKFFEKKKQPIPVRLTRKEALPFAVQKCLSSTFMYLSGGTCVTVKAGNTMMPPAKLLSNIQSICSDVPTKVPRKWSNIRSISIKTSASVALPIYNKTPEELEEIMKLAKEEEKQIVKDETTGDDKGKKKRKMAAAANSDLAKALKKQKAAEAKEEAEEEEVVQKPKKSAKKKRKESMDAAEQKAAEAKEETEEEEVVQKPKKSAKKKRKETMDDAEKETTVTKPAKTPKSSKKKRKESIDSSNDDGAEVEAEAETEVPAKTPKSSKKKKKKDVMEEAEETSVVKKEAKTPKSSKKQKSKTEDSTVASSVKKTPKKSSNDDSESATKDANFIRSKKFAGAKKGYVFKKGTNGCGYYKDVLPVVDKAWLASLARKSGGGGGGRKSMGHSMKKKKGGRSSRRSY
mmetsp:Transcript_31988/g.67698  ORF Transcript_31988/g.67698 Transcript_31988/m.67698 type:complete len:576 (+) Transcript_31988:104-1831(+)|eukprot:CAMPEP_0183758568 /NCGR_PEP_ID=MMETSP0739-20130205/6517_1 /TAXON_ID=385413 /ORGANISM="Thalassiosira miniscula, Strain CCMP1093" /LENGTH=575 /DNA_ID=CAMNT_0025996207 /DNA_START=66 /DNA_END=1793 /DNA_ORIENTATION=+